MSSEASSELEELEHYLNDPRPFQLVVRTKPRLTIYFRRKPITAYRPTEAQIRARIAFGRAAEKARGLKAVRGLLPPAAQMVRQELSGRSFGGSEKEPKWVKLLKLMIGYTEAETPKAVSQQQQVY